ncbi:MAG: GTP-binding protein [Thermoplasmata archaeon]|nr:MAG: GTP-binding protein [Thermoplasmata archaeon]
MTEIKLKICLIGEGAVGKTSLVKRFVYDSFDDTYISTIGTKITKKQVTLKHPQKEEEIDVTMLVWDIMGQKGFRELLQEAYFYGAQGLIAVCDVTNKFSLDEIGDWVSSAFGVTGEIPVAFMANKYDLRDNSEFGLEELEEFASKYKHSITLPASAKTGLNIEEAFVKLGMEILRE